MSLSKCGDHTGAAYLRTGLTSALYNKVKTLVRRTDCSSYQTKDTISFADNVEYGWVYHVMWFVIATPKSLTLSAILSFFSDK